MSVRRRSWTSPAGEQKEAWVVDYRDQYGHRHIKTFDRKKDADAYHDTTRVDVRAGTHTAPSRSVTVAEAGKLWLTSATNAGLERATLAGYQQHLKFHILPLIGEVKLAQLTVPMARVFADQLAQDRSASMVRAVMRSLGAVLADAQERGLVAQNVVRNLRRGRRNGSETRTARRQRGKLKVGVHIPTPAEIGAIVGHLEGPRRPLLLTGIFTGLRASELRGLRWSDIDLKRAALHVRQRVDRYQKIGPLKSTRSMRESAMVVVPHSMSTFPDATASSLLEASSGVHSTLSFERPSCFSIDVAILVHSSTLYPRTAPPRSLNENGAAPLRKPRWIVESDLIRSSVREGSASATMAASVAHTAMHIRARPT